MIGHLGSRVSALLDGQLAANEADRCWKHVHGCRECWDLVEREGWLKTQLAGLSRINDPGATPDALKGSLRNCALATGLPAAAGSGLRARTGMVLWGGTAVGAAVVGMLALGVAPSGVPADRRPPENNLTLPVSAGPTANPSTASSGDSSSREPIGPLADQRGRPSGVPSLGSFGASASGSSSREGIVSIGLSVSTHRVVGGIPGFKMVP